MENKNFNSTVTISLDEYEELKKALNEFKIFKKENTVIVPSTWDFSQYKIYTADDRIKFYFHN